MAESFVLFTKYNNTDSDYISTFLYNENVFLHQNYDIFAPSLKDLVIPNLWLVLLCRYKIRFLLVAGRTQKIIRVSTKTWIWQLQAVSFVSIEKFSGDCYLFWIGKNIGCIRCEENYTLMCELPDLMWSCAANCPMSRSRFLTWLHNSCPLLQLLVWSKVPRGTCKIEFPEDFK